MRRPVRLMQAVRAAVEDGRTLFTEVSPHPVLTGALRGTLPPTAVLTTGDLHTQIATAATAVAPRTSGRVVDVPHSPWRHVRHWAGALPPLAPPNLLDGRLVTRDWDPAPPREAGSSRAWLILADEGDARAARLHSLLGPTSTLLALPRGENALLPAGLDPSPPVLLLPSRGLSPAAARRVILVVSALAARGCRVSIGTERAQAVLQGERPDPGPAALRGLVRVLALERPELRATLVDFDDLADLAAELTHVDDTARGAGGEVRDDEVAWRGGVRYAARLRRASTPPARAPVLPVHAPEPPAGGADGVVGPGAYLITGGTGSLGRLVAARLAERGATRVVLNGRSEAEADGVVQVVTGTSRCPARRSGWWRRRRPAGCGCAA
ncbi:KR domain-containing protein [Nonomuraea thailandensis]